MWRLWHKLFGWHYVYVTKSSTPYIYRVRRNTITEETYIMLGYRMLVMKDDYTFDCHYPSTWKPLTWRAK